MDCTREKYLDYHFFSNNGIMSVLCLICKTHLKFRDETLKEHRKTCSNNLQFCNNREISSNKNPNRPNKSSMKRRKKDETSTNSILSLNTGSTQPSDEFLASATTDVTNDDMDEALARFFFGCNIPFTVVESIHFKNFIRILKPTYKPPTRKTLSTNILDKLHRKIMADRKCLQNTESVLLIDGWKNSAANTKNVVCVLHNASKKQQIFIESYDVSGISETAKALEEIVQKTIKIAQDLYGTSIYSVVSDNVSSMIAMGKSIDLWHTTCNSHSANLLAKSLVETGFATTVNNLLKEFKNPNLEQELKIRGGSKVVLACATRWCSYRDSFKCALKNFNFMKAIANEHEIKFHNEAHRALLQDPEFETRLVDYILIFDPICELINLCQRSTSNIADSIEYWLSLEIPVMNDDYEKIIKARIQKATRPICFAANYLHPIYLGKKLSVDQHEVALTFLTDHLTDIGLKELEIYQNKTGFFNKLFSYDLEDPHVFWSIAENHMPHLSKLALKLLNIPASTAELERLFSYWRYVHSSIRNRLTAERSKALVDIYYTLRFEDTFNFNELTL